MESRRLRQYVDALSATLAVLILDILLYNYFLQTNTINNNSFILIDVIIVPLAVVIGRKVAKQLGFPVWQVNYAEVESRRRIVISILIGLVIVGTNAIILYNYNADMIPWLRFTNVYQSLLLAIRASLTEEIVFRFLIFSVITKLACKISKTSVFCFALGAIVSSSAFGMLHNGFYLSFIIGIGLCYIYNNTGLIIPMIIHFLADFVPFTLIYMK